MMDEVEAEKKGQTGVELIDAADPFEIAFGDVVEGHKVEVSRKAVDGANSKLSDPGEEVLGHGHRLGEALSSDVGSHVDCK
jgi:hypothetical protein